MAFGLNYPLFTTKFPLFSILAILNLLFTPILKITSSLFKFHSHVSSLLQVKNSSKTWQIQANPSTFLGFPPWGMWVSSMDTFHLWSPTQSSHLLQNQSMYINNFHGSSFNCLDCDIEYDYRLKYTRIFTIYMNYMIYMKSLLHATMGLWKLCMSSVKFVSNDLKLLD